MQELGLTEADIEETFFTPRGKNKKENSGVNLFHKPTKTELRCAEKPDVSMNRFLAREMLCERLGKKFGEHADRRGKGPRRRHGKKGRRRKANSATEGQAKDKTS